MKYENVAKGHFISRPNRFIASIDINGIRHTVHVKNTGRCRELLIPGAKVLLEKSSNKNRKTEYDLIAVYKNDILVNMDSQAPNKAVGEWLQKGKLIQEPVLIKPEMVYGKSRLDFYVEGKNEKAYIEVKGVTLEKDKTAVFPDAPTQRGAKHLEELIKAKQKGFRAIAVFVIQMKGCRYFEPNYQTDPEFASQLKKAKDNGVEILALDCIVTENSITIDKELEVKL